MALRKKMGSEHGAQVKAARLLEIGPDVVSRLVSGKLGCSLEIALRIEKHFGIPAKWWVLPAADSEAA